MKQVITEGNLVIPTALVDALRAARRLVFFTGAGISAESGIPTFRDAQDGFWKRFDPMQLGSPEGFSKDPALVWQWYEWRRWLLADASPNPAHFALARLERLVPESAVITQNVDGLHERAGSRRVLRLHGSILENRCFAEGRLLNDSEIDRSSIPPRCPCGAYVRPGVVWFGEALPRDVWASAEAAIKECDFCLIAGTSAVVYPATSLVYQAPRKALRVVVNIEKTDHGRVADYLILAPAGKAVPALVEAAFGRESD